MSFTTILRRDEFILGNTTPAPLKVGERSTVPSEQRYFVESLYGKYAGEVSLTAALLEERANERKREERKLKRTL